jgi:hypothetical protein
LNLISNFNYQPFLALAFLSVLPLGILGIVFTKRGFTLAATSGDREKKDVGYSNFILGALIVIVGLVGIAFAFLLTD